MYKKREHESRKICGSFLYRSKWAFANGRIHTHTRNCWGKDRFAHEIMRGIQFVRPFCTIRRDSISLWMLGVSTKICHVWGELFHVVNRTHHQNDGFGYKNPNPKSTNWSNLVESSKTNQKDRIRHTMSRQNLSFLSSISFTYPAIRRCPRLLLLLQFCRNWFCKKICSHITPPAATARVWTAFTKS